MARKKHYNTYQDMLQHFLALYYSKREEIPAIKVRPEEHAKLVKELNDRYLKSMNKFHKDWETEETKGQLVKDIEFLTGTKLKIAHA